jgi:ABC-type nitrate/sulfonate/bicarbonate transport system substrate-binding protein
VSIPVPRHQRVLDRRRFLGRSLAAGGVALLGGPTLLAACGDDDTAATGGGSGGSGSGSTTDLSTVFAWVKNVEWAGWWVADDRGFFADNGIAPGFVGGGPNAPEVTQVLEADDAQLGTASDTLSIIDAVAEGSDLVMIAAVLQQSPLGLAWLDPEIRSLEDMVGKRIGGSPDSPLNIDAAFAVNDLPNDYEFVPIGFDPAPLANGEVDVIVCFVTNQPTTLELQGLEPISRTFSDFGTPLYADAIIGKRGYLDENRELVVGYLRAVIQGWEQNMRDPEEGARLAVEEYGADLGLDLEQSIRENERQIELQQSDLTEEKGLLWMDTEFMAGPVFEGIRATGRDRLPEVDALVDLSFLEEAYDGRTSLLEGE